MTSNPFNELKKWKITDLRNFIKQNNWKITGRSRDDIILKLKTKISKNKIQSQMVKYHPKISATKLSKSTKTKESQSKRLDTVEQQIKLLFQRINKIELKINNFSHNAPTISNKSLENLLLANIPTGTGILVDELLKHPSINHLPLSNIEKTILNLVDDGKIMVAEGSSRQKLNGYIGRLMKV